jgi:hypothetical protein
MLKFLLIFFIWLRKIFSILIFLTTSIRNLQLFFIFFSVLIYIMWFFYNNFLVY